MLEIETRVLQMLTLSREEDVPWLRLSPISISNLCLIYISIYIIYIYTHLVIVVAAGSRNLWEKFAVVGNVCFVAFVLHGLM